ncbi:MULTISPECIES: sugar transferase [Clostridium]|uniref:sugar transferase n=1 Tax=Clostridium TaxID=1485 RepID=UPI00291382CA|nr:sugar transferase [Clostridium sp.]MDU4145510.1 sugar transferase [Clostridium sp.]
MKEKILGLKRTVMFITMCIILLSNTLLFGYAWGTNYSDTIILPFYRRGNILVVVIYGVLLYIFTKIYNGYKVGFIKLSEIIYSQVLSLLFVNILTYLQISLIGRKFLSVSPMLWMTFIQFIVIIVWAVISNKIYFWIYPPRKTMLIYRGSDSEAIMKKMINHKEKFTITHKASIKEGVKHICDSLEDFDAVVISGADVKDRNYIIQYCYERSIRVYIIPTVEDIIISNSNTIHLFDTPMFLLRNRGLSPENRFAKRLIDILFSGFALIILSPIMIIVALLIKLYDGGPALFKQKRLTIDGRVFEVYKFRSMIVDAEKDGVARLASKNDNRITPIGKFIRAVRLDELPQLLNILKGDMSIVGPRPERPEIAKEYEKTMPEFAYRLKVKAGLTGYAQILGKYNTTPRDKLLLDMMYIEKYSLFLDIKLMLMTIKILFMSESTEGIDEGTILPSDLKEK